MEQTGRHHFLSGSQFDVGDRAGCVLLDAFGKKVRGASDAGVAPSVIVARDSLIRHASDPPGHGGESSVKRIARALTGVAVTAALTAVAPAAQAAPEAHDTPGWSLHFDGVSPPPRPTDLVSNWSGTCAVPGQSFGMLIRGEGRVVLVQPFVQCRDDGTYTTSQTLYNTDWRFEEGQTYTAFVDLRGVRVTMTTTI
ncbi:hypothetical protein [Streptomyces sp. NPDC003247]|uniref:hypothetical protein n=1 Tax=Streptomyces sp. NPDC003247 TaxID=3364677 RepID=UPI0036929365